MENIRESVIEFIYSNFMVADPQISDDDQLVDKGVIDSTGIIGLVSHIEEKYNIRIKDHEITLENFGSIGSITKFIEKHL